MINLLQKPLSPQAQKAYALLLKHKALSAAKIGRLMKVAPNSIYRNIRQLVQIGLVENGHQYPAKYHPKPLAAGLDLYTSIMRQNFFETFGTSSYSQKDPQISFFQTRSDFLKQANKDAGRATTQINFLVSGHEVPAETILAFKKAVDRKVRVRALVQGLRDRQMLKNWQLIGVEVKSTNYIGARIITFDEKISHLYSYNPSRQKEAVGVRFDYAPYALLMDELFEQKWQTGKNID